MSEFGQSRRFGHFGAMSAYPLMATEERTRRDVAGPRFFRKNTKREAIAHSHNLNRVTGVACEFNVRR